MLQAFSPSLPSDDHHAFAARCSSTPSFKNNFRFNHDHRNASAKPSGFRHQFGSKQTGPINPGAKRERDFQLLARKAADNAIRKKYFPELPDARPSTSRPSKPQAHVAASESTPKDAEDLSLPDNQEDVEQLDQYTDDEYFAMMVAQGHFDTEVEDFSNLEDADNK